MPITMQVEGLEELQARMLAFPAKYRQHMQLTLRKSLLDLWGNVPPYPPKPEGSTYERTGTLGRSLGSGMEGGQGAGRPDIYEITHGSRMDKAEFGTNLSYAPHVIGKNQADVHEGRWWTLEKVARDTKPKIIGNFRRMADNLARFLEGRGLL